MIILIKEEEDMKFNKNRLANAFALATAVLWVLCSAITWVLPDFSMQVTRWWMHGMNISALGNWNLNFSNFLFGGIATTVSAWVSGWVLGWSWEQVSKCYLNSTSTTTLWWFRKRFYLLTSLLITLGTRVFLAQC